MLSAASAWSSCSSVKPIRSTRLTPGAAVVVRGKPDCAGVDAEVVAGNTIATLPEVFALADEYGAGVRYNIETKIEADNPAMSASPEQFVDVILATTRAAGKLDKIDIQSFDWRTLPLVAAQDVPRGGFMARIRTVSGLLVTRLRQESEDAI